MLVYLSKKIAIPNDVTLRCISWNTDQGWIACGGDDGLLKVLKLEVPTGSDAVVKGIAGSSNLSMNQTLEGHKGAVVCASWNSIYRKLTTSDESGLIIVWMLSRGMWYEEMINNRNRSVVRDMKWSADGKKICIAYDDGMVIVGSVDGNRIWGNELRLSLRLVEWSPDGKFIVFITNDAEAILYSSSGTRIRVIALPAQERSSMGRDVSIAGFHWYNNSGAPTRSNGNIEAAPNCCIVFNDGICQLTRGVDPSAPTTGALATGRSSTPPAPIVFDSELEVNNCHWNPDGTIIAIGGLYRQNRNKNRDDKGASPERGGKSINMIKFYDAYGVPLRLLKIPGEALRGFSWEASNLRLALAVDHFIFFANVRPRYVWCHFGNSVAYTYYRPERKETALVLWNVKTHETQVKFLPSIKALHSAGDLCGVVIAVPTTTTITTPNTNTNTTNNNEDSKSGENSKLDDDEAEGKMADKEAAVSKNEKPVTTTRNEYRIQLRNAIGCVIDSRELPIEPKFSAMSGKHFICANERTVYVWHFRSSSTGTAAIIAPNNMGSAQAVAAAMKTGSVSSGNEGEGDNNEGGGVFSSKERMFDIENNFNPSIPSTKRKFGSVPHAAQPPDTFQVITDSVSDPVSAVTISDRYLVVARRSGEISRFTLPHLSAENTFYTNQKFESNDGSKEDGGGRKSNLRPQEPQYLSLNRSESKLAVVDANGVLNVLDLEARADGVVVEKRGFGDGAESKQAQDNYIQMGRKMAIEKKDVWDLKWASDDDDMLAVMEKMKLVVYHGEEPEEAVVASTYIAEFTELQVTGIALDNIMQEPDQTNPSADAVVKYDTRLLRDVREHLLTDGHVNAYNMVQKHPHPKLWTVLAEAALEDIDLDAADRAFVRALHYPGIQFVKRLRTMPDKMKVRAEISAYLKKFDEAEALYREIDRKDLAIELRNRIGDYSRVVQLLQTGGGTDAVIAKAWDRIGLHFFERCKWKKAVHSFTQANNYEKLADCYFRMGDYEKLATLPGAIPDGSPLLPNLAGLFECVGMADEAVECYLRSNDPKSAVDCCVNLNRWDKALSLAEQYDFPQVEGLLQRLASELIQKDRQLEAVDLFRRANKPHEAALLIGDIAETAARKDMKPSLAKKLHVLAALEVERHRKRTMDQAMNGATQQGNIAQATAATLETLMMTSLDTQATQAGGRSRGKAFGNAWRGAAAYHYLMLAQRQHYAGMHDAAMRTAIKLCEYDDILEQRDVYSLLILCSLHSNFFGVCSKAFVKLETVSGLPEQERDAIETLAVQIFIKHAPNDPAPLPEPYMKCLDMGRSYKACVLTGRAIQDSPAFMCKTCRFYMLEHEKINKKIKNCPLCHSLLPIE